MNTSGLGIGWEAKCVACGANFRAFSIKQTACSTECRFLQYQVKGDGCWGWSGPVCGGYGVLFLNQNYANGRRMTARAHRYAYERAYGAIPDDLCVMHTCDNRACTNPEHLKLGTWADNNRDRSRKGRSGVKTYSDEDKEHYSQTFRGVGNANAKLNDESARFIKYDRSMTIAELVEKFKISKTTIGHIRCGRAWKHV